MRNKHLPVETIHEIAGWCDGKTFLELGKTCKSLFALLQDEKIWDKIFRRDLTNENIPPPMYDGCIWIKWSLSHIVRQHFRRIRDFLECGRDTAYIFGIHEGILQKQSIVDGSWKTLLNGDYIAANRQPILHRCEPPWRLLTNERINKLRTFYPKTLDISPNSSKRMNRRVNTYKSGHR